MKICIVGAGVAGLSSARYCIESNFEFDVYEQTGQVGGTWYYNPNTGVDEYGVPIHSSMYQGLMTNVPKQIMEFEGFPFPESLKPSYITQEDVYEYIQQFANHFNLYKNIKFYHQVNNIEPKFDGRWIVSVKNLKNQSLQSFEYDAIVICNGHYKKFYVPEIEGIETFLGTQIHSHFYRSSDVYEGRKVLILGAGPSGIDISRLVSERAERVILSFKATRLPVSFEGIINKPWISKLNQHSAIFEDGSEEEIDDIIFCTGYRYSFPFLSKECGIEMEGNFVKNLYKHIININHPTMGFIGIPSQICPFPVVGFQVKFFLAYLKGEFKVSAEDMKADYGDFLRKQEIEGIDLNHMHIIALKQEEYCNDLASIANFRRIAPVIQKLYAHARKYRDRSQRFTVVNEDEFVLL